MRKLRSLPIKIRLNENDIREALTNADNSKIEHEVQVLRTGMFHHPDFGEFNITKEILTSMVQNFEDEVRGVDIAIDYSHDSGGAAAGWIQGLMLKEEDGFTELWALVAWTPGAAKKLSHKEFRYISADFTLDFQDNESLKRFGPTLLGAGLTNRPFVKNMQPAVTLSERNGGNMDLKELQKRLDELEAKNQSLESLNQKLSEDLSKVRKADYESQIKTLNNDIKTRDDKIAKFEADQKLSEKTKAFDSLVEKGTANPAQKEAYLKGDTAEYAKLAKPVKLDESGHGGGSRDGNDAAKYEDKVVKLAEEKMKSDKSLSFGNAQSLVLKENPELAKKYEKDENYVEVSTGGKE